MGLLLFDLDLKAGGAGGLRGRFGGDVFFGGRWGCAGCGGAFGPEAGVEVGEDAVAVLDLREAGGHVFVEGAVVLEGLPDGLEFEELVVVGEEAGFGVVARGAGGDEELPVGGLEQQELAAELLNDAGAESGVLPHAGGGDLTDVEFGRVDVGPGP